MIVAAGELVKECYRNFYVLADNQIKNVAKPYYRFRLKFSQATEKSVLIEIIDIAEDITNLESNYFKSKLEDNKVKINTNLEIFADDYINSASVSYHNQFILEYVSELDNIKSFNGYFYILQDRSGDKIEFFGIRTKIIKYPESKLTRDWLNQVYSLYKNRPRAAYFPEYIKYMALNYNNELINFYLNFPFITVKEGEDIKDILKKYDFTKYVNIFNRIPNHSINEAVDLISKCNFRNFLFKVKILVKLYNKNYNCNLELDKDIYEYIIKTLK